MIAMEKIGNDIWFIVLLLSPRWIWTSSRLYIPHYPSSFGGIQWWAGSNQDGEESFHNSEVPWQLEALWTGEEPPSIERCMEESEQHGLCTVSAYALSSLFILYFLNFMCSQYVLIFKPNFIFFPCSPDSDNKHGEYPHSSEFGHLSTWNNAYGGVKLCNYGHKFCWCYMWFCFDRSFSVRLLPHSF